MAGTTALASLRSSCRGLATYLYGYRYLPARVERRACEGTRLSAAQRRVVIALVAVMIITIFQSTAYYQLANVSRSGSSNMSLSRLEASVPSALVSIGQLAFQHPGCAAAVLDMARAGIAASRARRTRQDRHRRLDRRREQPDPGFRNLPFGIRSVYPIWPFLYSAGQGISFLYYWPTFLALVSRAAPAKLNATLMGLAFMTLFVSNNLIGWIGGFYEDDPAGFWTMHAAFAAGGGLLVLLFGRRLSRTLHPAPTS